MMIDSMLLRDMIKESGLKYGHIASKLNLTTTGLQKKLDNRSEFKASEIKGICTVLNLSAEQRDNVFFATESECYSTQQTHLS